MHAHTTLQVDHEAYQRMLAEYRAAKEEHQADQLKIRQCVLTTS